MEKFSGYALSVHTSSPDLGLAIANFAGDQRHQVWHLGREQSNLLHHYLEEFLQPQTWSDLTFLAVAIGPGGFTGTRIGVVLARTIAQQLDIPLFGISSLAAIAFSNSATPATAQPGETIAVQMPAQRGELHTGIYQRTSIGLTAVQTDTVMTPAAWKDRLQQQATSYRLIEAESAQGAYATSLLELAHQHWATGERPDWADVLPFYGQHPVTR